MHTIRDQCDGHRGGFEGRAALPCKSADCPTSEVYGKGNQIPFQGDDDVVLGPTTAAAGPTRTRRWSTSSWPWLTTGKKPAGRDFPTVQHSRAPADRAVWHGDTALRPTGPKRPGPDRLRRRSAVALLSACQGSAVEAILALAECQEAVGQVFNVGSTEEVTVQELAERVLKAKEGEGQSVKVRPIQPSMEEQISFIPYDQAYAVGFEV